MKVLTRRLLTGLVAIIVLPGILLGLGSIDTLAAPPPNYTQSVCVKESGRSDTLKYLEYYKDQPETMGQMLYNVVSNFKGLIGDCASNTLLNTYKEADKNRFFAQKVTDENIKKFADIETRGFQQSPYLCERTLGGFFNATDRANFLNKFHKTPMGQQDFLTAGVTMINKWPTECNNEPRINFHE